MKKRSISSSRRIVKRITVFIVSILFTTAVESKHSWVKKPDIPQPVRGMATAFYLDGNNSAAPGFVYLFGGSPSNLPSEVSDKVFAYSTASGKWEIKTAMPMAKQLFHAHLIGKKIYCAGGLDPEMVTASEMFIYDINTNSWSKGEPMPVPVSQYASFVYKDSLIYYVGGRTSDKKATNEVWYYDPAFDNWMPATAKPGEATLSLAAGISGGTIITAGGYSTSKSDPVADCYKGQIDPLNPSSIIWSKTLDYPGGAAYSLAGSSPFRELIPKIYFTSGVNNQYFPISHTYSYDVLTETWIQEQDKPTPNASNGNLVAAIFNDSLFMVSVGGWTGNGTTTAANEWIYVGSQIWSQPIEPINNPINWDIAPNPANTFITLISNTDFESSEITINNLYGDVVLRKTLNGASRNVDISRLPPGIYSLHLNDQNAVTIQQLIVY